MEALLQSIATKYGMEKAIQLLGIDKQEGNPKYTFGMPFTGGKLQINPMRMIANQGIKSIMGGGGSGILSTIGPLALGAGAIYFLNKNREKLTGYKTQQAYEDARNQRRADNRLDKITDRIISGKNYGNYEDALLGSGAGAVDVDGVIMSGADYSPEPGYKKLEAPKPKTYTPPYSNIHTNQRENDGGSTPSPSGGGRASAVAQEQSNRDFARGRFNQGGIASL